MKKIIILLLSVMLIIPFNIHAEELTYEEAQQAVKQTIQAWYMRGNNRQYNSAKGVVLGNHPEDVTVYDPGYSKCSIFTNDVWAESFGIKAGAGNKVGGLAPAGSGAYCDEARAYLDSKKCTSSNPNASGCNGTYAIYYYHKADNKEYIYSPQSGKNYKDFNNLLEILQPGDIFAFDGHVIILYDFKYENGKRVDALMFESRGRENKTITRIDAAYDQLFYYKTYNSTKNGILDLNSNTFVKFEGTTKWAWLSEYSTFLKLDSNKKIVKPLQLACNSTKCSITRAYYNNNGKAAYNYQIDEPGQINTSKARLEMPGLFIQKTSSALDNSSVTTGQTITYYINIVNNSNLAKDQGIEANKKYSNKTYNTIYIEEKIPGTVSFKSTHVGDSKVGTYDTKTRTVKWKITSLKPGDNIVIKYVVQVTGNKDYIGKTIEMNGKVYASNSNNYVKTGTIKHEIIDSSTVEDSKYKECYNTQKNKGYTAFELIQKTYECVYPDKWAKMPSASFKNFSISMLNDLIVHKAASNIQVKNTVYLNDNDTNKPYIDMILDGYWGGMNKTNKGTAFIPMWESDTSKIQRAKTIMKEHFQAGDVLIYYYNKDTGKTNYTKENGIYAYIYIDGKFVGVNHKGGTNERNEFTQDYYGKNGLKKGENLYNGAESYYDNAVYQKLYEMDSYLILRPEKIINNTKYIETATQVVTPPENKDPRENNNTQTNTTVENNQTNETTKPNESNNTVIDKPQTNTTTENVVIDDNPKIDVPIERIEVVQNNGTVSYNEETKEYTVDIIQKVYYKDGSEQTIDLSDHPDLYTITGYDEFKKEEQEVVINYQGHEVEVKVTPKENNDTQTNETVDVKKSSNIDIILGVILAIVVVDGLVLLKLQKKNIIENKK